MYIFTSKMVGYSLRIILPFLLVRLLTKLDFGTYRQFFLLEMLIASFFQLGVNQALYYFIPRDEKNAGAFFLNSLILNIIIFSSVFLVLGALIDPVSRILNMAVLKAYFWQLVVYTIFMMLIISTDCYLIARRREKQSAIFEILGQLLSSGLTVVGAVVYREVGAIISLLVVSRGVQFFFMLSYTHFKLKGFRASRYFFSIWNQVRYGLLLGFGGAMWTIVTRMHELFVSRYYGTEVYAVYSAGCTEIPIVQFYVQSLVAVALGQFARLEKANDWENMRALWNKILTSIYGLVIPVVLVFLVFSKPIVLFMFTQSYADAIPVFRINTLLKLQFIFNATLVLRAMNRNDVTMYLHTALVFMAVPVLYAGMKWNGYVGIITANLFLLVGGRVWAQLILNRIAEVRFPFFVPPGAVLRFYRDSYGKGRQWLSAKLKR
jgi:O-antigen/teichoic acid export membrane protein